MNIPAALRSALISLLLCTRAAPALAQDIYPTRTVKVIVPIVAGGAADTLPRIVADRLTKRFGQPFVIENRPGASLNLGAEIVAKAEPDGYTLLAGPPPPLAINQFLFSNLRFDPNAFVPVTVLAAVPNVLITHIDAPYKTLAELIAYAKANPDKLSFGSAGQGSSPHLAMEWLKNVTGMPMVHTPYSAGLTPAMNDVLGGHLSMMFNNLPNVLPFIREKKLRALAIDSEKRAAELPGVPALAELYPGFVVTTWFAIVAPPKTSPEIAAKLSKAIAEELKAPDVVKLLDALSAQAIGNTPAQAGAFIQAERVRWREVIGKIGVKID